MDSALKERTDTPFKRSSIAGCTLPYHPLYSETLGPEFEHGSSPIVQAALNIAKAVHDGHPRNKKRGIDKPFAYITHPIMVCKFLHAMQNMLPAKYADRKSLDDELYLAVALMHDVLEEKGTRYYHDPELLEEEFCKEIISCVISAEVKAELPLLSPDEMEREIHNRISRYPKNKYANLLHAAHIVVDDCRALCNPEKEEMKEGKRVFQVEHMLVLTPRQKLIKMLDQMASATEDVLFESDRDPQKILEFFFKALDVVKAGGANGSDEHKLAEEMFLRVFENFAGMRKSLDAGDYEAYQAQFKANRQNAWFSNVMKNAMAARCASLSDKTEHYGTQYQQMDYSIDTVLTGDAHHSPMYGEIVHPAFNPMAPQSSVNAREYNNQLTLPDYGCVMVKYRKEGDDLKVIGYSMRLPQNPDATLRGDVNEMVARKASTYLMGLFEMQWLGKQITVGTRHPYMGDMVRDYWLDKPILIDDFNRCVRQAGSMLYADLNAIINKNTGIRPGQEGYRSPEEIRCIEDTAIIRNPLRNPLLHAAMNYEIRKEMVRHESAARGFV